MKSGVIEVELFEREQKRERKERFLRLVGMGLLAMVAVSWGADSFEKSMTDVKTEALKYVTAAANVILFFMFMSKIIPALTGGQKDQNWWEIIGIVAACAVVNGADPIYKALGGK
jgi:hypothetical protein